jgi:hypothetical protein
MESADDILMHIGIHKSRLKDSGYDEGILMPLTEKRVEDELSGALLK